MIDKTFFLIAFNTFYQWFLSLALSSFSIPLFLNVSTWNMWAFCNPSHLLGSYLGLWHRRFAVPGMWISLFLFYLVTTQPSDFIQAPLFWRCLPNSQMRPDAPTVVSGNHTHMLYSICLTCSFIISTYLLAPCLLFLTRLYTT